MWTRSRLDLLFSKLLYTVYVYTKKTTSLEGDFWTRIVPYCLNRVIILILKVLCGVSFL
jgi:hypothetical protein